MSSPLDPGFTFRDYESRDFEDLVTLDGECFEPDVAYSKSEMRRFLSFATRVVTVAESGGRIAGFCIGYLAPGRAAHVITLDVRSGSRRTGLGRALLERTVARLTRAGAHETLLEVDVKNTNAIGFYERLGFRRRREIPDYYGPGKPGLEMARTEGK